MKSIRLLFLSAFTLLLFSACGFSRGNAPRNLKGMTVTYYTIATNQPCDRNIVGKTLTYEFYSDGTYSSRLGNQRYTQGSYSYGRTQPNIATITVSYATTQNNSLALDSPDADQSEELSYMFEMNFKSPTHGTWQTIYYDQSPVITDEYGTFQIIEKPDTSNSRS